MRLFILTLSLLALGGCAGHSDLKSPCGPSASLAKNPCTHIPLNVATLNDQKAKQS